MYRARVPLKRIQHLLGHDSVTTTEIYIKARLPDVAMPNMREIPCAKADADTPALPKGQSQGARSMETQEFSGAFIKGFFAGLSYPNCPPPAAKFIAVGSASALCYRGRPPPSRGGPTESHYAQIKHRLKRKKPNR